MDGLFPNRREAGKQLAAALSAYKNRSDAIVLALPRGGVPVGFEIAQALHVPLDLMLVRKLGVPGEEDLALGAIALPDIAVFNEDIVRSVEISEEDIEDVIAREAKELQRRNELYRNDAPMPHLEHRTVILVDDGMATGANMRAALSAVHQQQAARIIVAVPVAADQVIAALKKQANEVICLNIPRIFFAVGQAYESFTQVTDDEVLALLTEARGTGMKNTATSS